MAKLSDYLDKQIGFVQINKPVVYMDKGYECAAWWQERTSVNGVFPLYLKKKDNYSKHYNVVAHIPSIITDEDFTSLWGGVPISNKPYKSNNIGSIGRDITVSAPLVDAIESTGNIPDANIDWYVNPEIYELVIQDRKETLKECYNRLPEWWNQYNNEGVGKYNSNLSMVAHGSEEMAKIARDMERVIRKQGYLTEATDMWRELHKKNTQWTKA